MTKAQINDYAVEVEVSRKRATSVYGGSRLSVSYYITYKRYGYSNTHIVECEIMGLQSCQPYLRCIDSIEADGNIQNPETLSQDSVFSLIEEFID